MMRSAGESMRRLPVSGRGSRRSPRRWAVDRAPIRPDGECTIVRNRAGRRGPTGGTERTYSRNLRLQNRVPLDFSGNALDFLENVLNS